jgi:hypothetical protein
LLRLDELEASGPVTELTVLIVVALALGKVLPGELLKTVGSESLKALSQAANWRAAGVSGNCG